MEGGNERSVEMRDIKIHFSKNLLEHALQIDNSVLVGSHLNL